MTPTYFPDYGDQIGLPYAPLPRSSGRLFLVDPGVAGERRDFAFGVIGPLGGHAVAARSYFAEV
jgi:hypothetical protein